MSGTLKDSVQKCRDEEKPHSAIQAFRFGFEQSHCRTGKDSCNRTVRRIYGSTSSGRGRKIHNEECPFRIAELMILAASCFGRVGGLVVLIAIVALAGCQYDWRPPNRPGGVPSEATWVGGIDGGGWVLCQADEPLSGFPTFAPYGTRRADRSRAGRYRLQRQVQELESELPSPTSCITRTLRSRSKWTSGRTWVTQGRKFLGPKGGTP